MMQRLIIFAMSAILTAACATTPSDEMERQAREARENPRARYSADAGGEPVGVIPGAVLRDEERKKDVSVTIEYPTRGGPHPLIVFSPGFNASPAAYVGLSSFWASRGYVVIRPAHDDMDDRKQIRSLDQAWTTYSAAEWRDRVRDVTFVLDSLDRLAERFPELEGKIDENRIGVGGHSHGALTAMLVAGARTFPDATAQSDPRVKAAVIMSPVGTSDRLGLTRDSFAEIRVPALFMIGTRDVGTIESETPQWRREAFDLAPAGDKWLVLVEGARHASFTGRLGSLLEEQAIERERNMPPAYPQTRRTPARGSGRAVVREREIFASIRTVSLAFWDLYLSGDAAAREVLAGSGRGVEVEQR